MEGEAERAGLAALDGAVGGLGRGEPVDTGEGGLFEGSVGEGGVVWGWEDENLWVGLVCRRVLGED